MALPNGIKKFLDSLSADDLKVWLALKYGETHPIWEEVSKEEFDKHVGDSDFTMEWLERVLISEENYRRVPIYKDTGILAMMNSEPIGYRYEKQSGKEFVVLLGSDMMDYINSRKDLKDLI